ncbi:MAG TPA: hypothetical protein PLP19_05345 [bacterium]|nr:hypothetical protein [bacterium]HPN42896.1 hypothetical protein [bacterium]
MPDSLKFNDVLEAANNLPVDDQETLIDILNRRIHERRRTDIVQDVKAAQKEFAKKQCKPASPDELLKEIIQ